MKGINSILFVLFLCAASFGCRAQLAETAAARKADTPRTVTERFFDGSETSRKALVRRPPPEFLRCIGLTARECREETIDAVVRTRPAADGVQRVSLEPEMSFWTETYAESAASGKAVLKRILGEFSAGDESRVRVELEVEGRPVTKDVLLYRETVWQIFEIAAPGEYPNFAAPPTEEAKPTEAHTRPLAADALNPTFEMA